MGSDILWNNFCVLVAEENPNVFSSGHAFINFFLFLCFLALKSKNKFWNALLIIYGLLVCFLGIYVCIHLSFDVLTGIIVGILSVYYKFENKIIKIYYGVGGVFKM